MYLLKELNKLQSFSRFLGIKKVLKTVCSVASSFWKNQNFTCWKLPKFIFLLKKVALTHQNLTRLQFISSFSVPFANVFPTSWEWSIFQGEMTRFLEMVPQWVIILARKPHFQGYNNMDSGTPIMRHMWAELEY